MDRRDEKRERRRVTITDAGRSDEYANPEDAIWDPDADFYPLNQRNQAQPLKDLAERDISVEFSDYHAQKPLYENFAGEVRFDYENSRWTTDPHHIYYGCGPRSYRRADDRIRDEVCENLTADPYIDARDIDVEVEEGVVCLTGTVPKKAMKWRVEDAIEGILGVLDIENKIKPMKQIKTTHPPREHPRRIEP